MAGRAGEDEAAPLRHAASGGDYEDIGGEPPGAVLTPLAPLARGTTPFTWCQSHRSARARHANVLDVPLAKSGALPPPSTRIPLFLQV